MFSSKLVDVLKCFSSEEMAEFERFMNSPFFYKEPLAEDLLHFFQFLKSVHPEFRKTDLEKSVVYAKVYPGQAWERGSFAQLRSRMLQIVKKYIHQKNREASLSEAGVDLSMAKFYRENKQKKKFTQLIDKYDTKKNKRNKMRVDQHWYDYLMSREITQFHSQYDIRQIDFKISNLIEKLDIYYLIQRLEYSISLLSSQKHQSPIAIDKSLTFINELLVEKTDRKEEPLVQLLCLTYELLDKPQDDHTFNQLKHEFDQHRDQLTNHYCHLIHGVLRNYCLRSINQGNKSYSPVLFQLYDEGLKQDYLLYDGKILASTLSTMVQLGLKRQEFEWVENLIEAFRYRISSTEKQEEVYALNKASLLFVQKEFEEALAFLVYKFENVYLRLAARKLEIQIYYELNSDLLDTKIKAFKILIFRLSKKLLTPVQGQGYSNFIDLLKQIIHPATRYNAKRKATLVAKIENTKVLIERRWLLEKLEQMH